MTGTQPSVSVRNLSVRFPVDGGQVHAVHGVSFDLRPGETLGIVGESGSGKSTLALSLMRLVPSPGQIVADEVVIDGVDLLSLSGRGLRRLRGGTVGMVFQDPLTSLNPVLTIGTQIRETLSIHTELRGEAARRRCVELLDLVGIANAKQRVDSYPHQLSGGMRQRVAIAIAICANPRVLIADEPTTALDVTVQAQILQLLGDLRSELGMSILLVSHDFGVVASLADRVQVMYAGRIAESGSIGDVLSTASHPYTGALLQSLVRLDRARPERLNAIPGTTPVLLESDGGCPFAPRCTVATEECTTQTPPLVTIGQRSVACHHPNQRGPVGAQPVALVGPRPTREPQSAQRIGDEDQGDAPLLAVQDLRVHFKARTGLFRRGGEDVRAVDGVSFAVRHGETLGIVGESGCGKSTTGRAILRLLEPTSGSVRFAGVDLLGLNERQLRLQRRKMQMIFQDPYSSLDPRFSVADAIKEPLVIHGLATGASASDRVAELIDAVGLRPDALHRFPHEFSGGQRQRIAIARALAVEPELLVCDEPTSSLDVSVQAQVVNLLSDLQERLRLTYVFISHDLALVRHISHQVAVMYLGNIVELSSRDALFSRPLHPYTQALMSAVPTPDANHRRERIVLSGEVSGTAGPTQGCPFVRRCPHAIDRCRDEAPLLQPAGAPDQLVACHRWLEIPPLKGISA
jgi:peptide/nickel transport system ATP-binding protein